MVFLRDFFIPQSCYQILQFRYLVPTPIEIPLTFLCSHHQFALRRPSPTKHTTDFATDKSRSAYQVLRIVLRMDGCGSVYSIPNIANDKIEYFHRYFFFMLRLHLGGLQSSRQS
uniref:Uncharacterized protein n=1 Tax=Cacopsylla melanoneura TaxID=428564 RepID=A0A8D8M2E4_9HEMI